MEPAGRDPGRAFGVPRSGTSDALFRAKVQSFPDNFYARLGRPPDPLPWLSNKASMQRLLTCSIRAYRMARIHLYSELDPPRAVWIMLPAGAVTEGMIDAMSELLGTGDILIDGGNTFYKDDIRRAKTLESMNIAYVDVGTSGGVWGLERGYCMMIGGPKAAVDRLDPIFKALAPGIGTIARTPGRNTRDTRAEHGYILARPAGAGHFVKMIHNGIEYGLMQAYAEGFGILRGKADAHLPESERFTLDLADIAEVWRRGSVISSWLLVTAMALAEDSTLANFSGEVEDSGEGRWTV